MCMHKILMEVPMYSPASKLQIHNGVYWRALYLEKTSPMEFGFERAVWSSLSSLRGGEDLGEAQEGEKSPPGLLLHEPLLLWPNIALLLQEGLHKRDWLSFDSANGLPEGAWQKGRELKRKKNFLRQFWPASKASSWQHSWLNLLL